MSLKTKMLLSNVFPPTSPSDAPRGKTTLPAGVRSRSALQAMRRAEDLSSATSKFGGKSMRDEYIKNHAALPPMPKRFEYRPPSPSPLNHSHDFRDPDPPSPVRGRTTVHHGPGVNSILPHRAVKVATTDKVRYLHLRSNTTNRPSSGTLEESRPMYSSFSQDGIFHMNMRDPCSKTSEAYRASTPTGLNQTIGSIRRGGGSGLSGTLIG